MSTERHIRILLSVKNNSLWKGLHPYHKEVFEVILNNIVFLEQEHDDAGIITLYPGEACISLREILDQCSPFHTKNHVEGALKKFVELNFIKHEVRHKTSVITITVPYSYAQEFETSQTTLRQQNRDVSKTSQTTSQTINEFSNHLSTSIYDVVGGIGQTTSQTDLRQDFEKRSDTIVVVNNNINNNNSKQDAHEDLKIVKAFCQKRGLIFSDSFLLQLISKYSSKALSRSLIDYEKLPEKENLKNPQGWITKETKTYHEIIGFESQNPELKEGCIKPSA